ncbi:hypothetical protein OIV83_006167 [Microbotryomycetes sp. JL201]|nr:hypothetical protein OIV83_006167 [Microbotryomycetes sp. JL201]
MARIRIVSHAPLPLVKAWIDLDDGMHEPDRTRHGTVASVLLPKLRSVLGTDAQLVLELQGKTSNTPVLLFQIAEMISHLQGSKSCPHRHAQSSRRVKLATPATGPSFVVASHSSAASAAKKQRTNISAELKDPYGDLLPTTDMQSANMIHLAGQNKNKKKRIVTRTNGVPVQGKKTVFEAELGSQPSASSSSAIVDNHESGDGAIALEHTQEQAETNKKHVAGVVPSGRTDLPPNVLVSWTDVEARGWQAGFTQTVSGTADDFVPQASPCSLPSATRTIASKDMSRSDGYLSPADIRAKLGRNELTVIVTPADAVGSKVAFEVLELDPTSSQPTSALKYGTLVEVHDAVCVVRLHPSCVPVVTSSEAIEADVDDDWDGMHRRAKPKFGQEYWDSVNDQEDLSVWKGQPSVLVRLP